MRVLFLTPNFPNPSEPAKGMANYYTARSLAQGHHDVVVIAPIPWLKRRHRHTARAVPRIRQFDGIEVHHPRYFYPPGMFRAAYGWFLWRSIRPAAMEILRRARPDVLFAGWIHPDGDSALRIAAIAGSPGIMWSGGSDVLVLPKDSARRRRIVSVLTRADAIACVSAHLKDAIVDLGVDGRKVQVVRNGIDAGAFRPGDRREARLRLKLPPDGRILLYVGWLVPVKGVDVLIDACATLFADGLGVHLCLVGDGPLRQSLRVRARTAGLEDRVTFAGAVPHDALADWYRAADLTVLPSYSEGVPNVLYESISCGTPFVASDVGGISEIADPGLDRLVPPGDARALARAIRECLSASRGATRALMPDSWEEHALRLEAIFRRAVAARAADGIAARGTPRAG
jgi:glycosyltransferase involved in cell wall biosynthesis